MKNRRGFTLIELLGVIVIIGLLLTIAVPAVQKYLKHGKRAYYTSIEGEMKAAGMDYMETYKTLLPTVIGNSSVVELDELVVNKYIDEVKDEKGNLCTGQVKITKEKKNKYAYESCLNCNGYYSTNEEGCNFSEAGNKYPGPEYTIDPVCTNVSNCGVEICDDKNNCSGPNPPICTDNNPNCIIILSDNEITVDQGIGMLKMPYAKVYIEGQENPIKTDLEPIPSKVDTSKLGIVKVVYTYKGGKRVVTVNVVDRKKPTQPSIALRKESLTGTAYINEWYSGNIMAIFKSTDYADIGLMGSGIKEYRVYPKEEKEVVAPTESSKFEPLPAPFELVSKEGEYTRYIRAVDKSKAVNPQGNEGDYNQYTYRIDKTKPNKPSLVINGTPKADANGNLWYNKDKVPVTVTITHNGDVLPTGVNKNSGIKKIEYILSQATVLNPNRYTEINHGETITLKNNGVTTITAKVTDNADNVSATESTSVYIDKDPPVPPTITVASGTKGQSSSSGFLWYRSNVVLRLTYTEEVCPQYGCSKVEKMTYKLDKDATKGGQEKGETTIANNGTVTINTDGITTITVYLYDWAGNRSESKMTLGKDTVNPPNPTLAKVSGEYAYNNEWFNISNPNYNQPVTVRVSSGADEMSETYITEYWKSHPLTPLHGETGAGNFYGANNNTNVGFSESGITTIYAQTTDYAGNQSEVVMYNIKMDRESPSPATISILSGTTGNSYKDENNKDYTWYKSATVTFNVTPHGDNPNVETLSGYNRTTYKMTPDSNIGGNSLGETTIAETVANQTLTVNQNGKTTVTAYVYDNVGNKSTVTKNIYKDNIAPTTPTIKVTSGSKKVSGSEWYTSDVVVTITSGTDAHSKVLNTAYTVSSPNYASTTFTGSTKQITLSNSGTTTITARTTDKAGNISGTATLTVKIDKNAPTCTNSGDSTSWAKSRTINYGCSDPSSESGCETGSQSTTFTCANTGTVTTRQIGSYTIKDKAGNTTTCPARNANVYLDCTAPACPSIQWSGACSNGNSTNWAQSRRIYYGCDDEGRSGCASGYNNRYKDFVNTAITGTIDAYTVRDNLGNERTCPGGTGYVCVDATKPSCSTPTGQSTSCASGTRTIYYSGTDANSGLNPRFSGGSTPFSSTATSTTLGQYELRDNVGNSTTCSAQSVNVYIDNANPSVSLSPCGGSFSSSTNVTVTASDTGCAGLSSVTYNLNGTTGSTSNGGTINLKAPTSGTSTYTLKATATDSLGHSVTTSECKYTIEVVSYASAGTYKHTHTGNESLMTDKAWIKEDGKILENGNFPSDGKSGCRYKCTSICNGGTLVAITGGGTKVKCPACDYTLNNDVGRVIGPHCRKKCNGDVLSSNCTWSYTKDNCKKSTATQVSFQKATGTTPKRIKYTITGGGSVTSMTCGGTAATWNSAGYYEVPSGKTKCTAKITDANSQSVTYDITGL